MYRWKREHDAKKKQPPRQDLGQQLWMQVAVAVASSDNATTKHSMERWADHALAEFDKRFGETT